MLHWDTLSFWGRIIHYYKEPLPWIDELLRCSYPRTIEFVRALATGFGDFLGPVSMS